METLTGLLSRYRPNEEAGSMTQDAEVPAEVRLGISMLAPYKGFDWKWSGPDDGNYDAASTLSAVLVTVEFATVSSPVHLLLFHEGKYAGQGTPEAGAFVSLRHDDCSDDTVAVRFKIPGTSNVDTKSLHDVDFRWKDGSVQWSGDWPTDELGPPMSGWPKAPEG